MHRTTDPSIPSDQCTTTGYLPLDPRLEYFVIQSLCDEYFVHTFAEKCISNENIVD